ncbi:MAG: hypothetical protein R6V31_08870 [Halohasta sp.]
MSHCEWFGTEATSIGMERSDDRRSMAGTPNEVELDGRHNRSVASASSVVDPQRSVDGLILRDCAVCHRRHSVFWN